MGLMGMLKKLNVETRLFSYGLRLLSQPGGIISDLKKLFFCPYTARISSYDAIIIIQSVLSGHRTTLMIEQLRLQAPHIPILIYSVTYLSAIGLWGPWLEPSGPGVWGSGSGKVYGLDRYDWYLCVSKQNRYPVPLRGHPCSQIGLYLDDSSLFPEQNGQFKALIDFESDDYPREREIQLEALEETGTDYIILQGSYSISEIRAIYRTCSVYLVADMESFGLPICELQACGCQIMTPYSNWCDAHKPPALKAGHPPTLPENFIVYNNNKSKLINEITKLKHNYNPRRVIQRFRENQGHFMTGDLDALQDVLDRIKDGRITSESHRQYSGLMSHIQKRSG